MAGMRVSFPRGGLRPVSGLAPIRMPNAMALSQMGANPAYGRPSADAGKPWLSSFHGTDDTIKLMIEYARGNEGERNARVRQWSESIVRLLQPKDYLSEILALRHWATGKHLRYTNDARHVEQVKTPFRILKEVEQFDRSLVDCDDIATLLAAMGMQLGREARFGMAGFDPNHPDEFTHVFCCLREPRSQQWIVCDPVAGTREQEMLGAAKSFSFISVDN